MIAVVIFTVTASFANHLITIVPYPKEVKVNIGFLELNKNFKIFIKSKKLAPIAELLKKDFYTLYQVNTNIGSRKGKICLELDITLKEEEYQIKIDKKQIIVKGGSYNAVNFGATSILQLAKVKNEKLSFPYCIIKDEPTSVYRGVMLDVARQWHNIETVKQVVELCRWYKIRYLQIHLTDDQSFTFPSTAFPKLVSKDRHYTIKELKDLVAYAKQRGVVIIPEFDAPGHTSAMRKAMPQLFGEPSLGVIDMTKKEVYTAMETIMKEMMDIFYTSPYFHIGGDEAWLGEFNKKEETKAYVTANNFDNTHDIYLDFLVKMHQVVKSNNKKTLVWESFADNGSRKVKIPTDMIVFAWETAYQRPESLLKNGYTVINASWKPAYVTPGLRWDSEYIYKWNLHRWENHWNATPAYFNPIQLEKTKPIFGGQFCSWEMNEEQQIASIRNRVAAISEVFWNGENKKKYTNYKSRQVVTDSLYGLLNFPMTIKKEGFTEPNYKGIYFNRDNNFGDKATVVFTPTIQGCKATYTTDGSMPTVQSKILPKKIELTDDFSAKIGVFNTKGERIGYKLAKYEASPIIGTIIGDTIPLRDINTGRPRVEFTNTIQLELKNLKNNSELHYTLNGSTPTLESKLYTGSLTINTSLDIKVNCFYKGKVYGKMYRNKFIKKDYENNSTTRKKITAVDNENGIGINIEKAVDGFVDINGYWDNNNTAKKIVIDLEEETDISKIILFTYWDSNRFYKYTVDASVDGKKWKTVVDRSSNTKIATEKGYTDSFSKTKAKYIRVNMIKNSANKSMHIVEIRTY